jgi:hypothetical protein
MSKEISTSINQYKKVSRDPGLVGPKPLFDVLMNNFQGSWNLRLVLFEWGILGSQASWLPRGLGCFVGGCSRQRAVREVGTGRRWGNRAGLGSLAKFKTAAARADPETRAPRGGLRGQKKSAHGGPDAEKPLVFAIL